MPLHDSETPMMPLSLWRDAKHDVEFCRHFANSRILHLLKIDGDRSAGLFLADAEIDAVAVVSVVALDVALRSQQFLAAFLDFEMNVRRAARVRHRFDRAEII